MPLRRPTQRSSRPQRRKLVWARQSQLPSTTVAAASTTFIPLLTTFSTAYGADPIGTTVRRIRATFMFRNSATVGNSIRAYLGVFVSEGVPTTANQAPANFPHLDWMHWEQIFAEPVIGTEFATINRFMLDIRAQRRMEELGQDLYLAISNAHPTDALAYAYGSSVLLALP